MLQPRFITLPEKRVVGYGAKFISILAPVNNDSSIIPALWDKFMAQLPRLAHRSRGDACIGIVEELPADQKCGPQELFYIAGAEVATFQSAPSDMLQRTIPPGRCAAFTHKGKLAHLNKTMQYIYGIWVPTSGFQLRGAPHLEIYDARFNPASDASEFDILVPVR